MEEAEFSNNTIGEQLRSHLLPLLEARHEDVVELLLDQPALDAVLAREDGALGAVGVVEHAEHSGGKRLECGGMVGRWHKPRQIVLQSLAQHRLKSQVWPRKFDRQNWQHLALCGTTTLLSDHIQFQIAAHKM